MKAKVFMFLCLLSAGTLNASTLKFSTFLGGSGEDRSYSVSIDGNGNCYLTGETESSSFPVTAGTYDTSLNGYFDVFVTKLNSAGSLLLYSTFLGGTGLDYGKFFSVDASGNCYVTGLTGSIVFPTTVGAYDTSQNGIFDVFVTKLNSSGSSLVFSTFLGGSSSESGYSLSVDGSGNSYVTSHTYSSDFPVTAGAYDTSHNGSDDVFVTKLNSIGSSLLYSTFIGGNSSDYGHFLSVDGSGNCYVTGYPYSYDFPATVGAFDTSHDSGLDVFVAKLNSDGSSLDYSTFIGGSSYEEGYSISVDENGSCYVTGYTSSIVFPTTSGAYDTSFGGNSDVFVTKLNSSGSSLVFSTFLGGSSSESGYSLSVDGSGNCFITGNTGSSNFPTITGAYNTSYNDSWDVFVTKLNSGGSSLGYSTYLGGSSDDVGRSISVDGSGKCFVAGYTWSSDFPVTVGAYDTTHNGGNYDVFVLKLSLFSSPPIVVNTIPNLNLNEDFTVFVLADIDTIFTDPDPYDFLTFSASSQFGLVSTLFIGKNLYLNSIPNAFGTDTLLVTATDLSLASVTLAIPVMILPVNDAPENFSLVSPADGDSLQSLYNPVNFVWNASKDAENTPLNYTLTIFNSVSDTSFTNLSDTTFTFSGVLAELSTYWWLVTTTDGQLSTASADTFAFHTPLGVGVKFSENFIPKKFLLEQNFPNPFNPSTTISYTLAKANDVKLEVYNTKGALVRTLVSENKTSGKHTSVWDAKDESGKQVASGVYFYKLTAGNFVETKKMILLK